MNIADYVIKTVSTKSATRFHHSDFQSNGFKPSDHLSRCLVQKSKTNDQMH